MATKRASVSSSTGAAKPFPQRFGAASGAPKAATNSKGQTPTTNRLPTKKVAYPKG